MIRCSKCTIEQESDQFAFQNKRTGKRMAWCRDCVRSYDRERYLKDPYEVRRRTAQYVEIAREFVRQYKETHPCVDCGFSDPRALDFDHLWDKSHNVAHMVGKGHSLNSIKKEIAKCEVRCANCHRIVTHERRNVNQ